MLEINAGSDDIAIIPSPQLPRHFSVAQILAVLDEPKPMAHGAEFTGRPATSIFSDGGAVVKLRRDLQMKQADAWHWCQTRAKREYALGVHHPAKTWFILRHDTHWLVGNITPWLDALHQLGERDWTEQGLDIFSDYASLYFSALTADGSRLDDGLSNFGRDSEGRLYYLDDDLYSWDEGMAMAYALSNFIRTQGWLDAQRAWQFGEVIGKRCLEVTATRQYLASLTRQVIALHMPRDDQQACLDAIAQGLSVALKQYPKEARSRSLKHRFVAVLGDIHANQPALEQVLSYLDREGVEDILVVGDVVGYGPYPQACIDHLIQRQAMVISGNHDFVSGGGEIPRGFSPDARWVVEWTRERLEETQRQWLANLPRVFRQDDWMAVHGAPIDRYYFYAYVYAMTYEENLRYMADVGIRFCFHGHSHMPGVYYQDGNNHGFNGDAKLSLQRYSQALICPGSVGQPRSGQKGAEFGIFDRKTLDWQFIRLNYELDAMLEVMRRENFPHRLITRLMQGR